VNSMRAGIASLGTDRDESLRRRRDTLFRLSG
jgi:hypothetical protein